MNLSGLLLLFALAPATASSEELGHQLLDITSEGHSQTLMVRMTQEDCDLAVKVILHRKLNPEELAKVEGEKQAMSRFSADHRCSIMSFDGSMFGAGAPKCSFQSKTWNYAAATVAKSQHEQTVSDAKCIEVAF